MLPFCLGGLGCVCCTTGTCPLAALRVGLSGATRGLKTPGAPLNASPDPRGGAPGTKAPLPNLGGPPRPPEGGAPKGGGAIFSEPLPALFADPTG